MRFSSIFTLLCAIVALILSVLCLTAGSSRSFLQNDDILTLNISRIGHTSLFNTSSNGGGLLGTLISSGEQALNNLLNTAASDIAKSLNLTDFYSVHIMNYCEGYYEPNTTVKHPSDNTTHCKSGKALFGFDPTAAVQKALPSGITLKDIHWPQEIEDVTKAVKAASMVMFIFYIIGIIFAGLAIIGAVFGIFTSGRTSALVNFVLDLLGFLTIGIASAIVTVIMVKFVNAVNKYGADIGIAAYKGTTFLGMTWAATATMLLATFLSISQCVAGRKRKRAFTEKQAV